MDSCWYDFVSLDDERVVGCALVYCMMYHTFSLSTNTLDVKEDDNALNTSLSRRSHPLSQLSAYMYYILYLEPFTCTIQ